MKDKVLKFDDYEIRLIRFDDSDDYYKYGFENPDDELTYYTASADSYTKEQIRSYVEKITVDNTRYDFIICNGDELIGEVVVKNIEEKNGHYRIGLFHKRDFSRGIGYKATVEVLKFVFEEVGLETIYLEVFPFNERGIGLYKKLGFEIDKQIVDEEAEEPYKDVIIMRLRKEEFCQHVLSSQN